MLLGKPTALDSPDGETAHLPGIDPGNVKELAMKLSKISTGVAAGLLTASLAVAPQAFAEDTVDVPAPDNQQSSLNDLSSNNDGEGKGEGKDGSSDGEGKGSSEDGEGSSLDDKQKKILGGVLGGIAGLALLAGIFNFLQSQGGNLPFKLPF